MRTKKIKIRPECYPWLRACSHEVNFVWNYCRWIYATGIDRGRWLSGFDLINLVTGAAAEFSRVGQASVNCVAREYERKAKQSGKKRLRRRNSRGARRSCGWIPVKPEQLAKRKGDRFRFCGKIIRLFESIEGFQFREGCIVEDSLGDWYLCMPYEEVDTTPSPVATACGVDLGLKTSATTSGGEKLEMSFYRDMETKLAGLQRRGHKRQAKFLHRKIARKRAHAVHNFSRKLVNKYGNIFIGDVSFDFLKSGTAAKAAYDSGISMLKTQLLYKGQQAGRCVSVISERFTTQACSACESLSGPAGRTGLVVREWQCSDCGTEHDRDVNAAINICHLGMKHHPPCAGTSQTRGKPPSQLSTAMRGMDQRAVGTT